MVDDRHADPDPLSARAAAGLARAIEALRPPQHGVPFDVIMALARSVEGRGLRLDLAAADAIGVPIIVLRERRAEGSLTHLSNRERQVARLIGRGLSNRQIAAALGISETTVKDHVHNALAKCGMSRRTQLAAASARLEP